MSAIQRFRDAAFVAFALIFATVGGTSYAQGVSFLQVEGFNANGMAQLIGVVQNDTNGPIEFVQIISSIYDSNGDYLNNGFTFTSLDVLLPNERSPFSMIIFEEKPFARYDYQVQWSSSAGPADRTATVVASRGSTTFGFYEITGQVRNDGTRPLEYVQVIATAYDAAGQLAGVGFTFTSLDVLHPGGTSPFSLLITDPIRAIDSFELVVQGSPR